MYYFLCHLALVDAGFTTSVVPPLLANLRGRALWLQRGGCLAQLCASLALGSAECVLLAVMALDRAAAVCRPLRYAGLASPRLCRALAGASWLGGLTNRRRRRPSASGPLCPPHQWTTSSASCPRYSNWPAAAAGTSQSARCLLPG
ncbi:putative olfactory receptor 2I1 [Camelus dromedarius]|uniref:Putative olfactory receptor 2I1 n=1 Tax=Camelus dromedarius TaxID=9838 RepID=A0A5N4CSY8_CAMDR|nr:putative olfactory receptor 2I1 [Camelus dromedarius]